mgnify:CR=1 FL=1
MKPSISRKMDMVKDVFLKQKKLEEDIAFIDFVYSNPDYYQEDYTLPMLLTEGNSKRKVSTKKNKISNSRKCRIKNSKGKYIDIKKIKQDKKDDTHILELPPPDGDENLITTGNQMRIPESLRLLGKVKRGKKKFKDFINQKPTFIRKKTEEILF